MLAPYTAAQGACRRMHTHGCAHSTRGTRRARANEATRSSWCGWHRATSRSTRTGVHRTERTAPWRRRRTTAVHGRAGTRRHLQWCSRVEWRAAARSCAIRVPAGCRTGACSSTRTTARTSITASTTTPATARRRSSTRPTAAGWSPTCRCPPAWSPLPTRSRPWPMCRWSPTHSSVLYRAVAGVSRSRTVPSCLSPSKASVRTHGRSTSSKACWTPSRTYAWRRSIRATLHGKASAAAPRP
mmetsp:Transcript_15485/g.60549  ORF Transcript_15485/g.60549 Transcript_15485/m.60549 type:complete len:242 (+) Transcript_15485:823-1548(+)